MPRIAAIDWTAGLIALAVLAAIPLFGVTTYTIGVLTVCLCYAIWAASWDFMSGLTGRENFGHALFIGAGAYTAGFLNVEFDLNPWWGLPAGAAAAVLFSLLVGFPTLRLRGPYFALAMLSAATVMQYLTIIFSEVTGGQDGLNGLFPILDSQLAYYYLTLGFLAATVLILKLLALSPWGTILRAIRGDEATCQAAGINVTFYKIAALAISAFFAGLGGALYASLYSLEPTLGSLFILKAVEAAILAGIGSVTGALIGGLLLGITEGIGSIYLPLAFRDVYGLVFLVAILLLKPSGLFAGRR